MSVPATTTSSPHPLIRELEAGRISEASFLESLAALGTPLVGPVNEGMADVTFVFIADGSEESISVDDLVSRHADRELPLNQVAQTRVWAATRRLPSDIRASYWFNVHRSGSEPEMAHDPHCRWNGYGDPRLDASVLTLPDAEPLTWIDALQDDGSSARSDSGAPKVDVHEVESARLRDSRRVWVSVPAGEAPDGGWPFVVVFDGTDDHLAPRIRDQVVAAGTRPFAVVLVDPMGRRETELTANAAYSAMIATELVPWLRERYPLSTDPRDVVVSGSSFGGLCAGFTALRHPDVFGGALMQSPSCWYHPAIIEAWQTKTPDVRVHLPVIIALFDEAEPAPIRIWQECGSFEQGPPPAQIAQRLGNRWLYDVLQRKGYDVRYSEFAGGHDAAWWRDRWGHAMHWLLS